MVVSILLLLCPNAFKLNGKFCWSEEGFDMMKLWNRAKATMIRAETFSLKRWYTNPCPHYNSSCCLTLQVNRLCRKARPGLYPDFSLPLDRSLCCLWRTLSRRLQLCEDNAWLLRSKLQRLMHSVNFQAIQVTRHTTIISPSLGSA